MKPYNVINTGAQGNAVHPKTLQLQTTAKITEAENGDENFTNLWRENTIYTLSPKTETPGEMTTLV